MVRVAKLDKATTQRARMSTQNKGAIHPGIAGQKDTHESSLSSIVGK